MAYKSEAIDHAGDIASWLNISSKYERRDNDVRAHRD